MQCSSSDIGISLYIEKKAVASGILQPAHHGLLKLKINDKQKRDTLCGVFCDFLFKKLYIHSETPKKFSTICFPHLVMKDSG
jgi:hypothetical protein